MYGGDAFRDASLNQFMQEDALRQQRQQEEAAARRGGAPLAAAGLPNVLRESRSTSRFDAKDVGYGPAPMPVTTPGNALVLPLYSQQQNTRGASLTHSFSTPALASSTAGRFGADATPPRLLRRPTATLFGARFDADGEPILPVEFPAGAVRPHPRYILALALNARIHVSFMPGRRPTRLSHMTRT